MTTRLRFWLLMMDATNLLGPRFRRLYLRTVRKASDATEWGPPLTEDDYYPTGFSSPTAAYWDAVRNAAERTSGRFPASLLRLARRRMGARENFTADLTGEDA